MAGRSVGNIEVTVDANTGRLKAQVVKASKAAGEAGGEAIEEGLSDIDSRELIARIRLIRTEVERALAGIAVDIDFQDVEPELQRLQARVRAAQIELFLHPEVDDADLQELLLGLRIRLAAAAKPEVEVDPVLSSREIAELAVETQAALDLVDTHLSVDMEPDLGSWRVALFEAVAEADAAKEAMEADEVEFQLQLRSALALAEGEAVREEIDGLEAAIQLDLDTKEATLKKFAFIRETEADRIDFQVGLDILRSNVAFDRARMEEMMGELGIPADVTLADATAHMTAWRREQEANAIDIPVDVDTSSLDGGGGGQGLSTRWKAIIAGIITLAEPAAVALQGVLASATSVLSSAFSALGGTVGAALPLLAGLIPATTAVVVGFQGMGTALGAVGDEFAAATAEGRDFSLQTDEIQAAMKGLAPSAQDVVVAFSELQPQLAAIQQSVQGELFAGMGDALRSLSETAIPSIGDALTIAASSVNEFFRQIAFEAGAIDWGGMMADLKPAVDAIGDALSDVFAALAPLISAATPAAQMLADSLAEGAGNLRQMIEAGAASGKLTEFFKEGVESLREWGNLLVATGDALFTLFEAGKDSGDSFVVSLTNVISKFDSWMESTAGQTALQTFFESGERVMKAMVPILEGLQGLFKNLVTEDSIGRFEALADAVGRILPVLGQLFEIVGRVGILNTTIEAIARIGEAIQPAVPALQRLADALGTLLVGAVDSLTPLVEGLGPLLAQVADAITPLIPVIQKAGEHFIEMVTPPLLDALAAFADALTELSPLVLALMDAMMPLLDVAIVPIVAALQILTPALQLFADILSALGPVIDIALAPLKLFAETLLVMHAPLKLLGDLVGGVGDKIHDVFTTDVHGTAVIADEFAQKNQEAAEKVLEVVAAVTLLKKLDAAGRAILAAGENLGGFAVNAQTAAEAQRHFDDMAARSASSLDETSSALDDAAESAQQAADAADNLRQSWDLLFGSGASVQETAIAQAQAFDDLKKSIEENGRTLDISTEKGRNNATQVLDTIDTIKAHTAAQIEDQGVTKQTISQYRDQRQALIDQVEPFFKNRKAAAAYLTTLGLVPPSKVTDIAVEGANEAGQEITDLDLAIRGLSGKTVTVEEIGARGSKIRVEDLDGNIRRLKGKVVSVKEDGAGNSIVRVETLDGKIISLKSKTVNVDANVDGEDDVQNMIDKVNALHDRTIYVNAVARTGANVAVQHGGQVPLGMTGLIAEAGGPEFYRLGTTRGLAVTPSVVPGGTVVTSTALTAAQLRQQAAAGTGQVINRQLNLVQNITPLSADPAAVAAQVVNRAAAMAGG